MVQTVTNPTEQLREIRIWRDWKKSTNTSTAESSFVTPGLIGLLKGSYGVPQLEGKSGSDVAFLGRHNRKGVEEVLGTGEIT